MITNELMKFLSLRTTCLKVMKTPNVSYDCICVLLLSAHNLGNLVFPAYQPLLHHCIVFLLLCLAPSTTSATSNCIM
jgi:hypothetical protein